MFVAGLMETEAVSVTGVMGEEVTITCSHTYASSNVKYFCGGACKDEDVLISSRTNDQNGKYSIQDEGNTFTVTISRLTEDDAGTYWCGIDRVGADTYREVDLTVISKLQHCNSFYDAVILHHFKKDLCSISFLLEYFTTLSGSHSSLQQTRKK